MSWKIWSVRCRRARWRASPLAVNHSRSAPRYFLEVADEGPKLVAISSWVTTTPTVLWGVGEEVRPQPARPAVAAPMASPTCTAVPKPQPAGCSAAVASQCRIPSSSFDLLLGGRAGRPSDQGGL